MAPYTLSVSDVEVPANLVSRVFHAFQKGVKSAVIDELATSDGLEGTEVSFETPTDNPAKKVAQSRIIAEIE
jgi:hypothetical protein